MNLTLSEQILKLLQDLPLSAVELQLQHTSGPGWRFLQVTVAHLARPETEILQAGQALENAKEIVCMAETLSSLRVPLKIARRGQKHLEQLAIQAKREKQEQEEARQLRRLAKLEQLKKYESGEPLVTPEPPPETSVKPARKIRKVPGQPSKKPVKSSSPHGFITRSAGGQFFYGEVEIVMPHEPRLVFDQAFALNGNWVCRKRGEIWTENERQHFTTIRRCLRAAGANPNLVLEVKRKSKRESARFRLKPTCLTKNR